MEIKLKVEGAQLTDDVRELLDNLTVEQKRDMAMQLLKDALEDSTANSSASPTMTATTTS